MNSQAIHEQGVVERVCKFLRQDFDYFYGFTQGDVTRLNEVFSDLTQNSETTFPDFYGQDACVELFRISSSATKKHGGAPQMKQDGDLASEIADDDEEAAKSCNFETRTYTRTHPAHSYEALTENLRYQVEKHVKSKRLSGKVFDTCIFVVENSEVDLCCMFQPLDSIDIEGLRVGDLMPMYGIGRRDGLYRLSRDKANLEWLAQYTNDIDYLVFCGINTIEAINLHHVKEIVALLPWKLVAKPSPTITIVSSTPLSCEISDDCYEKD